MATSPNLTDACRCMQTRTNQLQYFKYSTYKQQLKNVVENESPLHNIVIIVYWL